MGSLRKNGRLGDPALPSLSSSSFHVKHFHPKFLESPHSAKAPSVRRKEPGWSNGSARVLAMRALCIIGLNWCPNCGCSRKKVRSRIFQHITVPDILRQLFQGLDVKYEISETYYPRDYCVQYRESDFNFASRLMEDEGIYYFFQYGEESHQMILSDAPTQHPDLSGQSNVIYDEVSGGVRNDMRITAWEKSQQLGSGICTLWDHSFELPNKNLEAKRKTLDSVVVGEVTHKLSVGGNDKLEIYDYPGGYAQRFDGIDHNGAARPQDLQQKRTAKGLMNSTGRCHLWMGTLLAALY